MRFPLGCTVCYTIAKCLLILNSAWTFGTSFVAIHLTNAFGPTGADNWGRLTVFKF